MRADRVKMNTNGVSSGPALTNSAGNWLVCRVGDRLVAVPLGCVVETMRPMPLQGFSGAPDFILGVSVIRGLVVPVIDIASALGVQRAAPGRFVTIKLDDRMVALAVESVTGVRTLDEADLHDVPPLLGALDQAALSAIGTLDSWLLLVLGEARLVPEAIWATLDERVASS